MFPGKFFQVGIFARFVVISVDFWFLLELEVLLETDILSGLLGLCKVEEGAV